MEPTSLATGTPAPAEPRDEVVCWWQRPVQFELRSNDPAFIRRAETVLGYWRDDSGAETFAPDPVELSAMAENGNYRVSRWKDVPARLPSIATALRAIEGEAALALLSHYHEVLSIHCACLSRNGCGILIVGPSQSGKSTLACALWRSGWSLLTDDVTLFYGNEVLAHPLLRRISLRTPSRELIGEELWERVTTAPASDPTSEGYVFQPAEVSDCPLAKSTKIAAIVFLGREGARPLAPGNYAKLQAVESVLSLAMYTNVAREANLGAAMQRLEPLVNSTVSHDLARGPIAVMIGAINEIAEGANSQ